MTSVYRIVRLPEVVARTGLCARTIRYMVADEAFPAPVKLGKRAVGWRENDIDAWIAALERTKALA